MRWLPVFLHQQRLLFETFHRGHDVTQAAGTAWVPDVAGTTLRGDVLVDPGNDLRAPVRHELAPDTGLGLAEAVTEGSCAAGLLLPHRHTDIVSTKPIAAVADVHRRAGRIRAEPVVRQPNSSKRDHRQQRLDGLELNR
jgi:hypothetical protein